MNDFEWDVMKKKQIARSERYHNRKKSGCRLPSDNLTEAEKRKLNGDVATVKLNEPMVYAQFKQLPKTLQETYYNGIVNRFGVGCPAIAEMMGCSETALRTHLKKLGIDKAKGDAGGKGKKAQEEFYKWALGQEEKQETTENNEPIQRSLPDELVNYESSKTEKSSQLKRLAFEWHGVENISDILRFLGNLPLPNNARVRVTIEEGKDGQMD